MIYGLVVILACIIGILCIKIYLLKKSAREIANEFTNRLQTDTNTLVCISGHDKDMCALAGSVNEQLRILRQKYYQYTQGDKRLKETITNVSHDLRTPLTVICGYLDILKHMEKSAKVEKYLDIIDERAEFMSQLTEELFRYSVILMKDDTGETEEIFINQLLAESIAAYYTLFVEHGITPQIHMTDRRVVRKLNRYSLSRVFANLLSNAVKYSDGDLEITLTDAGKIIFSNTAKDLSPVQLERIFDRFYTVETARNSTGLGLSIAKSLVEDMGGILTADYREEKLSFLLDFPE